MAQAAILVPSALVLFAGQALAWVPSMRGPLSMEEVQAGAFILAGLVFLLNRYNFRDANAPTQTNLRGYLGGHAEVVLGETSEQYVPQPPASPRRSAVRVLLLSDPAFSTSILGERVRLLLAALYEAGPHSSELPDALRPFVLGSAWSEAGRLTDPAGSVTWGRATLVELQQNSSYLLAKWRVCASFRKDGVLARRRYTVTVQRTSASRSRTPQEMAHLDCPACDLPIQLKLGECQHCGTNISHGQRCWQIRSIEHYEFHPPLGDMTLGLTGPVHRSAEYPLIASDDLDSQRRAFQARHPSLDMGQLHRRAAQAALIWLTSLSSGRREPFLGHGTDSLIAELDLSLAALDSVGQSILASKPTFEQVHPMAFDQDGWFERLSFRVSVQMSWRVMDPDGRCVGGSDEGPVLFACDLVLLHPMAPQIDLQKLRLGRIVVTKGVQ